jgi:hypothetical protein
MTPKLKPSGTKRLKLKCIVLLPISALKINLRRYIKETELRETIVTIRESHRVETDRLVLMHTTAGLAALTRPPCSAVLHIEHPRLLS